MNNEQLLAAKASVMAPELAPTFASEPIRDWIWRSVELGKSIDDRYEKVFQLWRSSDSIPSDTGSATTLHDLNRRDLVIRLNANC